MLKKDAYYHTKVLTSGVFRTLTLKWHASTFPKEDTYEEIFVPASGHGPSRVGGPSAARARRLHQLP